MEIVDAQIHATHRGLDQTVAIMDAVGVNAAVLDDWPPTRQKLEGGIIPLLVSLRGRGGDSLPGTFCLRGPLRPK